MSGHEREFAVVERLIGDGFPTAGVDALALAVIKSERQMRRLMTYSVFQSKTFERESIGELRKILAARSRIYFGGLRRGFEMLSGVAIADAFGEQAGDYETDIERVRKYRNKLFHGQLTEDFLDFSQLSELARNLSSSSKLIGDMCEAKIGYKGFDQSYIKGGNPQLVARVTELLPDLDAYKRLLVELEKRHDKPARLGS
jgi:hypothetical protein